MSRHLRCVLFVFVMNMPYPPSRRVALVSFIILGCNDTTQKAADATARSARFDDEALKIVSNFWTEPQFRDGMTQQQIDAIINVPHERPLNVSCPSGVS